MAKCQPHGSSIPCTGNSDLAAAGDDSPGFVPPLPPSDEEEEEGELPPLPPEDPPDNLVPVPKIEPSLPGTNSGLPSISLNDNLCFARS